MSEQSVLVSPQSALARLLQQKKKRAADSPAVEPQEAEEKSAATAVKPTSAIDGDAPPSKPTVTVAKDTALGRLLNAKKAKTTQNPEVSELPAGDSQPAIPSTTQDSATQSLPSVTQSQDVTELIVSPEISSPAPASVTKKRGRQRKDQASAQGASPAAAKPPRKPRTPKSKVAKEEKTPVVEKAKDGEGAGQTGAGGSDDDFASPESAAKEEAVAKKPARKPVAKKATTPRASGKKAKSLRDMMADMYKSLQTMAFVRHWSGKLHQVPISRRSEPMSEFMEKIAAASGVPVDKQNLLFRGRRLVAMDEEGKPTTLFTYNITFGDMLQLIREPGDTMVEAEEKLVEADPAASAPSVSASEPAAPSTKPSTSIDAQKLPSTGTGSGSSSGGVTCRVAVGLNDDGTIACEQPPGTVHNTDSGVPTDQSVVCRWGRVWVLAAAPSVESTIAPTPTPVASKKSTKATEGDDFNPDGSDDSNGGSDDASGSEDASAGSDSEDDAVDMTEPTCLKDCEARMGLHTANNGKFEAVMLLEVADDGIMGSFVESGDVVTLSEADAIAAVKRYLETKQVMASRKTRRGSSKSKRASKGKPSPAESAPTKAKGKGKKKAAAKGFVEFHFTHGFAGKSKMPAPSYYRLLWRELPAIDPESHEDAAVREVMMEEDAVRPFVVVSAAKVTHAHHDIVVKVPQSAVQAGEFTLGLTIQRDECSCSQCLGDDAVNSCPSCGCAVCHLKIEGDKTIICDECGKCYHHYCLQELEGSHMTIFADGRDVQRQGNLTEAEFQELVNTENEVGTKWCCPSCNVRNQVKAAAKEKKQRLGDKKEGWGGGLATAGYTKKCALPADHIGRIPGVPVGTTFMSRVKAGEAGVHRAAMAGIHGRANKGAFAICHSAGYDNADGGEWLWYTGQGGRNLEGNKRTNTVHSKDQEMKLGNAALLTSHNAEDWKAGLPVRVLRGHKLDGRVAPDFAPVVPVGYDKAYRYDGLYKVAEFKEEKDDSGFGVYKFRMVRDDPEPAVWTAEGRVPYAKIIVSIEKQVRAELVAAGYGPQIVAAEASCFEATSGGKLPGAFGGVAIDADLDAEEEKVYEKLDTDPEFVDFVLGRSSQEGCGDEDGVKAPSEPVSVKKPRKPRAPKAPQAPAPADAVAASPADNHPTTSASEPQLLPSPVEGTSTKDDDFPLPDGFDDFEDDEPVIKSAGKRKRGRATTTSRKAKAVESEEEEAELSSSSESEQSEAFPSESESDVPRKKPAPRARQTVARAAKQRRVIKESESESSSDGNDTLDSDAPVVKRQPAKPAARRGRAVKQSRPQHADDSDDLEPAPAVVSRLRSRRAVSYVEVIDSSSSSDEASSEESVVDASGDEESEASAGQVVSPESESEDVPGSDDDVKGKAKVKARGKGRAVASSSTVKATPVAKPPQKSTVAPAASPNKTADIAMGPKAPASVAPPTKSGAENAELVKVIEADTLNASRWDTLRKKFRVATLPITAAKLEAISNVFRCAVTQELITAPAVTPMCCKQNISASQLKACFSKMDASTMCPLCRTDLSGLGKIEVGSALFPINHAMTDAIEKLFST